MKPQSFSVHARLRSFRYAWEGIAAFMQREHNAWLHFMATVAVVTLAALVKLTKSELLALVFVIGLVWITEMVNTCIEHIMDHVTPHHHPDVKFIKDLASGSVLVAAFTAVITAGIVFIPKLLAA